MTQPPCLFLLALLATSCQSASTGPPADTPGASEIVIGTSLALPSTIFDETREINVCLPWGYEQGSDSYPVLYLVDGGVNQDFKSMAGMAALATLSGQYREFILVGVKTNDRHFELTASSETDFDLEQIPSNGGSPSFRAHLLEEVMPFIEASYRTSGEDALIGESLAGLFVVETFLREPEAFAHYIAVSPSLWWRGQALGREAAGLLGAGGFAGRSLDLSIADEGQLFPIMQIGMDLLVQALGEHAPEGLAWKYTPMPLEHHNTIYKPASLYALRRAFAVEE